jgi:DHA1 family inner membrane transport protein
MPLAVYALMAGAFGIGVTEFVIMGLLLEISATFGVNVQATGLLISGYAMGVVVGAPLLTIFTGGWPRKRVLLGLMAVFIIGNIACALAPSYAWLMLAPIVTAFAHGTFFGVGSVLATSLVARNKQASAIAVMFTGLTLATVLGVPLGTWLGQTHGWRATFWVVAVVGVLAWAVLAAFVPPDRSRHATPNWRADLRAMACTPVLLGLLTTVLGYAGLFAVFTYIAPLLKQISGFVDSAIAPILLVFGGGLVAGNLLGGRLADKRLGPTVLSSLAVLAAVLIAMTWALPHQGLAIAFVGLLGAAAFATVAPLQMWIMQQAQGAGENLAASFNIAAFNLGNALGAWAGGVIIVEGPGLGAVTWLAATAPLAAIGVVLGSRRLSTSVTSKNLVCSDCS